MDFFKRIFGLESRENKPQKERTREFQKIVPSNEHDNFEEFTRFFEDTPDANNIPKRGFDIFTDPLQMHQYFEQQMNEMFKAFGMPNGDIFSNFGGMPQIEDRPSLFDDNNYNTPEDLREHYLKKGYENPALPSERVDKDIDGKIQLGDIETILRGKNSEIQPYVDEKHNIMPKNYFFGKSMSTKTVRNSDGSIETTKTVKDNAGNEEITVTKKLRDKEYTKIVKRDTSGKEEVLENFINMDENDKERMFAKLPSNNPHNDFPFDKFFK